jgi:hypothetical protein
LVRQFLNFVQDQRIELVQLGWQVCNLPRRAKTSSVPVSIVIQMKQRAHSGMHTKSSRR